jgi:hypothetical protein
MQRATVGIITNILIRRTIITNTSIRADNCYGCINTGGQLLRIYQYGGHYGCINAAGNCYGCIDTAGNYYGCHLIRRATVTDASKYGGQLRSGHPDADASKYRGQLPKSCQVGTRTHTDASTSGNRTKHSLAGKVAGRYQCLAGGWDTLHSTASSNIRINDIGMIVNTNIPSQAIFLALSSNVAHVWHGISATTNQRSWEITNRKLKATTCESTLERYIAYEDK